MKRGDFFLLLISIITVCTSGHGQIVQKTGYIYSEVASSISSMPGDSGDHYAEPSNLQLDTWGNTLKRLLDGDYSAASDSVGTLGYQLVCFTDTFSTPHTTYYILKNAGTNFWGTYVYNPGYHRPLVIQAPHSRKDANTGHQGIHVFRKAQAMFYQVNGTHRCNSSVYTSCTGSTTSCSSVTEPYRVSDLAHATQSVFQKTTEVLYTSFDDTYFIQLHGFTKRSSDPYVILSNGTQQTPSPDYHRDFRDHLLREDSVLTMKVAHIDTSWTRLRGFWNTQGRYINGSPDPCNTNAETTNGRFFHMEQERDRLRKDVSGWNKVANALINTFESKPSHVGELAAPGRLTVYPNPASHSLHIEWDIAAEDSPDVRVYNLLGQDMRRHVRVANERPGRAILQVFRLPPGMYMLVHGYSTVRVFKY